jgi:hypothetical protein
MTCHKCAWSKSVAVWAAQGVPYEKTPCASCDGTDKEAYVVEYREGVGADVSGAGMGQEDWPPAAREYPLSLLGDVVKLLMRLTPAELRAVNLRYSGLSFNVIGRKCRVSGRAARGMVARAVKHAPLLRVLLPPGYVHGVDGDEFGADPDLEAAA